MMSEQAQIRAHMDITPIKECKNLSESYGMICVLCNQCGRFETREDKEREWAR